MLLFWFLILYKIQTHNKKIDVFKESGGKLPLIHDSNTTAQIIIKLQRHPGYLINPNTF